MMLRSIQKTKLSIANHMNFMKDFSIYELRNRQVHSSNAREAADLLLLSKRGYKASLLQSERLDELYFFEQNHINQIKSDENRCLRWAEAIKECLADGRSQDANQISCLLFLGALFDIDAKIYFSDIKNVLPREVIFSETKNIDPLIWYLAMTDLKKLISEIDTWMTEANNMHHLDKLYGHLVTIYCFVSRRPDLDESGEIRKKIQDKIKWRFDDLAQMTTDLSYPVYELIIKMRHDLPKTERNIYIEKLKLFAVPENTDDEIMLAKEHVVKRTLASLQAIDDPDTLYKHIKEHFTLTENFFNDAKWHHDHLSDDALPMVLSKIKIALRSNDNEDAIVNAFDYASSLIDRLDQNQLLDLSKVIVDCYARQSSLIRENLILANLCATLNDEKLVELERYVVKSNAVDTSEMLKVISFESSTICFEKYIGSLKNEDYADYICMLVCRAIMGRDYLTESQFNELFDAYCDADNRYEGDVDILIPALSHVIAHQTTDIQGKMTGNIISVCEKEYGPSNNAENFEPEPFSSLIRCLSATLQDEQMIEVKEKIQALLDSHGEFFYPIVLKRISNLNNNGMDELNSLKFGSSTKMIQCGIECEKNFRLMNNQRIHSKISSEPSDTVEKVKQAASSGVRFGASLRWLPSNHSDPNILEPLHVTKNKPHALKSFSTLGGYSLLKSKTDLYNGNESLNKVKIKFCVDSTSHDRAVVKRKIFSSTDSQHEIFKMKREAFCLHKLGMLRAFYQRTDGNGTIKLYLIHDWTEGVTLQERLQSQKPRTFLESLCMANGILSALIELNSRGIGHWHIDPKYIICTEQGKYHFINFENSVPINPDENYELLMADNQIFNDLFDESQWNQITKKRREISGVTTFKNPSKTTARELQDIYAQAFDDLIEHEMSLTHQNPLSIM